MPFFWGIHVPNGYLIWINCGWSTAHRFSTTVTCQRISALCSWCIQDTWSAQRSHSPWSLIPTFDWLAGISTPCRQENLGGAHCVQICEIFWNGMMLLKELQACRKPYRIVTGMYMKFMTTTTTIVTYYIYIYYIYMGILSTKVSCDPCEGPRVISDMLFTVVQWKVTSPGVENNHLGGTHLIFSWLKEWPVHPPFFQNFEKLV